MKRFCIICLMIITSIFSAYAVDPPEWSTTASYSGTLEENITAQARLVWDVIEQSYVSLWFSGSSDSNKPDDENSEETFTLSPDSRWSPPYYYNDSIYLHYSVYGNVSATISIKAEGPMHTSDNLGAVDWAIFENDSSGTPISGADEYAAGVLLDNVNDANDSIRLYVRTKPLSEASLVSGNNDYYSYMEVEIEIN